MKARFLHAVAFLFGLIAHAHADPDYRARYTPYPDDGFPQIIQRNDYPTISFVESMYEALVDASSGVRGPGQFGIAVDCEISAKAMTFRSTKDPKKAAVLRKSTDKEMVTLRDTRYSSEPTVVLCSTLLAVLNDLTVSHGPCRGVRASQFGTRAYRRRTTINFDFHGVTAVVDCFSNGPKSEERLYILDIVRRPASLHYAPPSGPYDPTIERRDDSPR